MTWSARPLQSREHGGASLTVSHRAAHEALARQRRADRIAISGTILRMKPIRRAAGNGAISAEQPSTCVIVSATCQRNGPSSTRCSAFLGNNRMHTRIESPVDSGLLRGNGIFVGKDYAAETVSLEFD